MPHSLEKQKQKQILTNSIKILKMDHIKKNFKNKIIYKDTHALIALRSGRKISEEVILKSGFPLRTLCLQITGKAGNHIQGHNLQNPGFNK